MSVDDTQARPDAPAEPSVIATWELHYGLRCSFIGEDGDMVIHGHHDDLRSVAALNRMYRNYVGEQLDHGYGYEGVAAGLKRRWARFITRCDDSECDGADPECWKCSEIKELPWWMEYGATEPAPDLFPVTLWSP